MAANLASMFSQLNNTIAANPLGQRANATVPGMAQRPQDTINPMLSGAFKGLTGAMGGDPEPLQTSQEAYSSGMKAIESLDLSTAKGLTQAAEVYQKLGMQPQALALLDKAQAKEQQALALQQKQAYSESLIARAEKIGYKDLADGIRSGGGDLQEQAKLVREAEILDIASTKGWPAQKALLTNAGFTESEVENYRGASPEDIKALVEGQKGDTKGYVNADGKPVMLRTSDFGRVWDEKQGKFVNPSELNLTPAPSVQKIQNVSSKMVDELAMGGVANFQELYTAANDAQVTIDNIDRNLPLIENMPTGLGANVELLARRIASTLGDDPDAAVANAETYTADAAQRVAKEIKAFGSGTGLSDKDREFTEKMAAGDITMTPEALTRILKIRRDVAATTQRHFNETKAKIAGQIDSPEVLEAYTIRPSQATPAPAPVRRTYDPATGTLK